MNIYLHDIPLPQAQEIYRHALEQAGLWQVLGSEEILLDENAIGRVLCKAVWAKISSPHYHASAMDGFAVRAEETNGALPSVPVILQIGEQAQYLDTGDPIPDQFNAVVPIEQVEALDETGQISPDLRQPVAICLRTALTPWMHVRPMGEDIIASQLVLPSGQALRPVDLGAAAACGMNSLWVSRKPIVAILPTGSELVPVGQPVERGDIIEYNSIVLAAQVMQWGGQPRRYSITPDDYGKLRECIQRAVEESDLVLVNAGSSAGAEDFTAKLIEELGQLLVHGVAVRPGHPVILGMIKRKDGVQNVPVIGVPGYPVSAALTGEIFVEEIIRKWIGAAVAEPLEIEATLTRKIVSPAGDDDYVRMMVGRVGERLVAAPLSRGAGVITSLVHADGITILARGTQGLEAGSRVKVRLYRNPAELERTIFVIGSHDLTLDLLAQFISPKRRRLVSANVGSQGGLIALSRREAHLAGSHLLNPQTGEYNLSYIQKYLPGISVGIYGWVGRQQGLIVRKGNPKKIMKLSDLAQPGVRYVNRQRGSGTRVLLDFELYKLGLESDKIAGYNEEEFNHLAVAAAVLSGRADCGLGIAAAAQALDLGFVPLFSETYQLIIPTEHLASGLLDPIFEIAADDKFREAVAALPGYDIGHMGELIQVI